MRTISRRWILKLALLTAMATTSVVEAAPYVPVAVTVHNGWNRTVTVTLSGAGVNPVSRVLRPGETWVARSTSNAKTGLLTVVYQNQSRQSRPAWGDYRSIIADRTSFKIVP